MDRIKEVVVVDAVRSAIGKSGRKGMERFTPRVQEIEMHIPQGVCSEMISKDQGHTREELDQFGMWSMQKCVNAERKGWYADHIVPYEFTHGGMRVPSQF